MVDALTTPPPPLLEVSGLTKHYPLRHRGLGKAVPAALRAVDGVSFSLEGGETLGTCSASLAVGSLQSRERLSGWRSLHQESRTIVVPIYLE